MNIKFSVMNMLDLTDVLALERGCFSTPWSEKLFRDELEQEYSRIMLARDDNGKLVGFICFWILVDEMHILNIAVAEGLRRRGIGTMLVKEAISYAVRRGARSATLEVRESNAAAIGLYSSLGFEMAGIRKSYYEKPRENAVIMWVYELSPGRGKTP